MTTYQPICAIAEVPEGQARMVLVAGRRLAVIHSGGEFYVIDDTCPHAGASLARGIVEGQSVRCRIHHWRFCMGSGRYLDEDRSEFNIRSYDVRIVDGNLEAALD